MSRGSRRGEDGGSEDSVEIRLDISRILVALGAIGTLALFWFLLRSSSGDAGRPAPDGTVRPGEVPARVDDVSEDLTFFDRLGENGEREAAGSAGSPDRAGIEDMAPSPEKPPRRPSVAGAEGKTLSSAPAGAGSPADTTPTVTDPRAARGFVVQVFAGDREGAEKLRVRLTGAGYPAYLLEEAGEPTRVRLGPYSTESAAKDASSRVAVEGVSTWIIPPR